MNMLAKHIWITGASSGIGEALAKLLASKGHHVIITARNIDKLMGISNGISNMTVLQADLCKACDIEKIRHYFSTRNLDIAIINAGTCEYMNNARLDSTAMKRVYDINFFAAVESIHAVLPALERSSCPHIIGVSSMSVYLPFSRAEYYASSKAAFTYYLQSLSIDIHCRGIAVTTVYPGFVETPLTRKNDFAMPFIIGPEVAARHFINVIDKRPLEYAFPKKMHYLLTFLKKMPAYWFKQQAKNVLYKEGNTV